jgi:hypothetical protein
LVEELKKTKEPKERIRIKLEMNRLIDQRLEALKSREWANEERVEPDFWACHRPDIDERGRSGPGDRSEAPEDQMGRRPIYPKPPKKGDGR